ncbi:MAG: efflux transporter periplasmic adaptor subunit [Legionellales bacterium RIFCSPHIGHO2_12_FULL_42_9]|nr:MAG: efflux transporter periplasmic adaptor subunit [Legionellales bacterium RIFCSPHIGHO2_12_FULL_42_9]
MKRIKIKINKALRQNKRLKIMIIGLLVVFGGIIAFNLFKQVMIWRFFANYEPAPVTISTVSAKMRPWRPEIDAVGNFTASHGVEINAQASGNVVKIHFESGQYIEAGQPLIDIDDDVEQATLKFYQAQLTLQELNYQRMVNLYKRNAAAISTVDEAKANLDQAKSNVQKTEAQIHYKHITAPFSGRLGIRQANLGQYITPGQTSIVSLQAQDPLYLEFYLPEQLNKRIFVGQHLKFQVEEFPQASFEAQINAINSKIDPKTHNIQVQATVANCPTDAIKNPKQSPYITITKDTETNRNIVHCSTELNKNNHLSQFTFIPGMFASINVEEPSTAEVIVLPSTSISFSLYGNSVFIIEKDKDGKKDDNDNAILRAKRVFVNTGEQQGNDTIITQGIKAGQLVASSGELKLQNGTRVLIDNSVPLSAVNSPDTLGY